MAHVPEAELSTTSNLVNSNDQSIIRNQFVLSPFHAVDPVILAKFIAGAVRSIHSMEGAGAAMLARDICRHAYARLENDISQLGEGSITDYPRQLLEGDQTGVGTRIARVSTLSSLRLPTAVPDAAATAATTPTTFRTDDADPGTATSHAAAAESVGEQVVPRALRRLGTAVVSL